VLCGNQADSAELACEWDYHTARHLSKAKTDPAPDRNANKKKENLRPMLGGDSQDVYQSFEKWGARSLWKSVPPGGQILSGVCFKSWLPLVSLAIAECVHSAWCSPLCLPMGILALSNLKLFACVGIIWWCGLRFPGSSTKLCDAKLLNLSRMAHNLLLDPWHHNSSLPAMAFDTWRISRHLNKQPSDELFNASFKGRRQKATTGAPAHPALSRSLICANEFLTPTDKLTFDLLIFTKSKCFFANT
jgi:hypothetical protein